MGMFRRAMSSGALKGAGFPVLGRLVVRHPLLVIAAWVALGAVLFLTLPPLADVATRKPPGLLPANSSVMAANDDMQKAFAKGGGGSTSNVVVIVLTDQKGLSPADEDTYRALVNKLRGDPNVESMQDFVDIPELRQVMTSDDKQAWQLPVSLEGGMGTGPGQRAYRHVVKVVKDATRDSTLKTNVIGPAATFDDVNEIGVRDQHVIEIATVVIVLAILILVYRNLVAMLLPMAMIGGALVVAQAVVAGLGDAGILSLGPQTLMLMTAVLMGAGVDYAVFLFTRYHECIRSGQASDDAIVAALESIGKVIAGSMGTTALAFFGLSFTQLAVFSTVGPALSVTVFVGFLASITLLPALIVLVGRRGWVNPRRDLTGRWWRRSGVRIVRRPRVHLVVSLLILIALASCVSMIHYNYDDRKNLPADAASNLGYDALNKHFPISTTVQQFLLIQSDKDLRGPKALADMEQMARRVADLPNIDMVRGITRPTGEVLEQAKATYQAGEVGGKLGQASDLIDENDKNLSMLTGGAHQLADTLDQLRGGVSQAVVTVRPLANALADLEQKLGGATPMRDVDNAVQLVSQMHSLGDALAVNIARINDMYNWAAPVVNALNMSPICSLDPACVSARTDLQQMAAAKNDGSLEKLAQVSRELQHTDLGQNLDQTVTGLTTSIDQALAAAQKLGMDNPGKVDQQLASVQQGANLLADSSEKLAQGVQLLVDQTRNMNGGLQQASDFLLAMKRDAASPSAAGFYIPPQILTQAEFEKAANMFISPDGHTARYLVQTALNPFSTQAMDQVKQIIKTARSALPNTTLSNAKISLVGFSAMQNEIRNYYNADIQFIILATLAVVFLILVVLLRSLVAPLYLVGSVVLSWLSALGIGVLFFQFILKQDIAWSMPGMTFLVLVAVGADYNLLLISRIRDEAGRGVRTGIIRTVGATGGVITSAGLIFAASMFGLTFSSIVGAVQIGFVIGVGLLLDTFLVRTVTVPSIAVLMGDLNWWPSKKFAKLHRRKGFSGGIAEPVTEPVGVATSSLPTTRMPSPRSPARPVGSATTCGLRRTARQRYRDGMAATMSRASKRRSRKHSLL